MTPSENNSSAEELPGLRVTIDKIIHQEMEEPADDEQHAFIYFITISNLSDRTVTLLGRKWIITNADGSKLIVEGDKIVQQTPKLAPGESFSYNSYHVTSQNALAEGAFHGKDDQGAKIFTRIPQFQLIIPNPGFGPAEI
ncbi:MAG: ApaG domain [Verrucomicrobiota bacterium]